MFENERPPLIIYHGNCPDGFTAAWIAARSYRDEGRSAELFAGAYGQDPPYDKAAGRDVCVVDFSYPREKLEKLYTAALGQSISMGQNASVFEGSLIVLDHHKTAEADLRGLNYCIFDMERSGAGLTWDWLYPGSDRPWIVDYVEDRDLWRFKLPDSRDVSLFIRTAPYTLEAWDAMAALRVEDVIGIARGCKRYLDHYIQDALRNLYTVDEYSWVGDGDKTDGAKALHYVKFSAVNVSYTGVSDVLEASLKQTGYPMALAWHVARDGQINCSLRSDATFDCSLFARAHGGGGHAQASGFRLTMEHPLARKLVGAVV